MKQKYIILASFALSLLISPALTFAHPGRTDASGCHTCRTNCPNWGLSTGEYHCHNAKALPQPKEPIHSRYGENGTGYTEPAPEYKQSAPALAPSPAASIDKAATPKKQSFWQWLTGIFR